MGLWKKIMKRFEWIVFDLDGTIIDSTNELYKIYKLFLKEFGFNGSKTEFNRLNGPKLEEIISQIDSLEANNDDAEITVRRQLFNLEKDLPPVDVMFLYDVINKLGELADRAEQVGHRITLIAAR